MTGELRRAPRRRARPPIAALLAVLVAGGVALTACEASAAAAPLATAKATTAAVVKPLGRITLPAHPRVYFFGDSWTHGYSAAAGHGFPAVVGATLGWKVQLAPDGSGAGYSHTWNAHPVYPQAAKALPRIHADLIVLEGGINDEPGPLDQEWVHVQQTIRTLKSKSGGAPVVVVGMANPSGTPAEADGAITSDEAGAAAAERVHFISPLGWITPANAPLLIDKRTGHPSTAGHAYFAGRLAAALAEITRQR